MSACVACIFAQKSAGRASARAFFFAFVAAPEPLDAAEEAFAFGVAIGAGAFGELAEQEMNYANIRIEY
jgi:hypothetical protein